MGRGGLTAILLRCCETPPCRGGGGRQVARRASECRWRVPHPTKVSSETYWELKTLGNNVRGRILRGQKYGKIQAEKCFDRTLNPVTHGL